MLLGRLLIIPPNSKHALGFLNKHLQKRTGDAHGRTGNFHGVSMGSAQSSWILRKNGSFSINEQSGSEPRKWVLSRSALSNRVRLFLKTPSGFGKIFARAYSSLMANQDDSEERKQDEGFEQVSGSDHNGNGGGNESKNGGNIGDDGGGENMAALVWLWYWKWWQHRESNKQDKDNNNDKMNMNQLEFFEKIYNDVILVPISRLVLEVLPLDALTTLLTEVHVSRGMPRFAAYLKAIWTTLWLACWLMVALVMFVLGVLAIGPMVLALMALESYLWSSPPPSPNHSDESDDNNEDAVSTPSIELSQP